MDTGVNAVMHLDGCHFYVWVAEGEQTDQWIVSYDERTGQNLALHGGDDCERCKKLRRGAPTFSQRMEMKPQIPQQTFGALLETLAANLPEGIL